MFFMTLIQAGRSEPYPNQIFRHVDGLHNLHHNEATTTGNGTDADIACLHTSCISVTGTGTRTVGFYGSVDGISYVPLQATNIATGVAATSVSDSNDAAYRADVRGLIKLRVAISAVSGNVTVKSFSIR